MLEFKIVEIIDSGISYDGQKAWIKVRDESGFLVAFWGRPSKLFMLDKDMNNIESIRNTEIPFDLKVTSEGDFNAEKYERENYHIKYSIGECAKIEISRNA